MVLWLPVKMSERIFAPSLGWYNTLTQNPRDRAYLAVIVKESIILEFIIHVRVER